MSSNSNSKKNKQENKYKFASNLRSNPTPSELVIWNFLKSKPEGIEFWSQYVLLGYIVDFYCPSAKTAIEIDGAVHDSQKYYDAKRDQHIGMADVAVLRIKNSEVKENKEIVVSKILNFVKKRGAKSAIKHGHKTGQKGIFNNTQLDVPQENIKVATNSSKIEVIPGQEKVFLIRCNWCMHQWFAALSKNKACYKCHNTDYVFVCKTCQMREISKGIICLKCFEARQIARREVGKGHQTFGQGKYRARKIY